MKHKSTYLLQILAYVGFISLGLPDGVLGVAWPAIRSFFGLPLEALGPLLIMFTLGSIFASFSSGRILARMNVGVLLALSCAATALSLIGFALTHSWWLMVGLAAVAGLGAGAIDTGLNTYAATHFSARSVNWLHASYGIGATLGPVIMTSVLNAQHPWQWGYALIGSLQLALALCFGVTNQRWADSREARDARHKSPHAPSASVLAQVSNRSTLQLPVMWLSMGAFFIYTGIESTAGAWAYSVFTESRGVPLLVAGTWTSVYWGSLTTGRLLSGFVVNHVPLRRLLRFCILGIALGAVLMWLDLTNLLSFVGFALIGLCCAPIFPSLIATTPQRLGETHTANAVGFQIAAGVLGLALLPGFVGVLAKNFSLESVAPALLGAAILLWGLYESILRRNRDTRVCASVAPSE